MRLSKLIQYFYPLVIISLFLYSFTQVDLSLTLSRVSVWQGIQRGFQYIGYFNRPLSTLIFVLIISLMFAFYIYFLAQVFKKRIKIKEIWILIILTAVILAFAYNAFSYDLFNYIFDAKIITHYHQNPYFHKALDYPGDPMLSFMQWTHRLYPYGPIWLALTIPLSFIGLNFFLVNFFLFKFLAAGFYLGSAYLIAKINRKILPEHENFNLVLFALNPLVMVESLVSAHNDIAMIFFALLGIYFYFFGKKILTAILIIISSQIKIPTVALLFPVALSLLPLKTKLTNQRFILISILVSIATFLYVLTKIEIQPWYFLWVFPLICLLKPNKYVLSISIGFCLGLLLRYTVFLYFGNWDGIAIPLRNGFTIAGLLIPVFLVFTADKFVRKLL